MRNRELKSQIYTLDDMDVRDNYINNKTLIKFIELYKQNLDFSNILEIGCGNGRFSNILSKYGNVYCIEPTRELNFYLFNDQITFEKITFQEFKTDQKFTLIVLISTFMYLDKPDYQTNFTKLVSLLAPHGKLIILEHFTRFIEDGFDLKRFRNLYKGRKSPWKQEKFGFFDLKVLAGTTSKIIDIVDLNEKYRIKIIGKII